MDISCVLPGAIRLKFLPAGYRSGWFFQDPGLVFCILTDLSGFYFTIIFVPMNFQTNLGCLFIIFAKLHATFPAFFYTLR